MNESFTYLYGFFQYPNKYFHQLYYFHVQLSKKLLKINNICIVPILFNNLFYLIKKIIEYLC